MKRITGRLAEVHKSLASAARCASHGRNGWIEKDGGYLVPDNSALSHKIKKMIAKEAAKADHAMVPLYQEAGVYNFYLEVDVPGAAMETTTETGEWKEAEATPWQDVKALTADPDQMSKEELKAEVLKMRGSSRTSLCQRGAETAALSHALSRETAFQRQPKA